MEETNEPIVAEQSAPIDVEQVITDVEPVIEPEVVVETPVEEVKPE